MEPARRQLTVLEFLERVPEDGRHYQLLGGVIVAMAPPGSAHQVLAGNLAGELYAAVRAHRPECRVRSQAGIAPYGLHGRDHFEADLAVSCTPPREGDRGLVHEPLLVVEILSPSTERDDVLVKLPAYRDIGSIREIAYVETDRMLVTVYRRGADGGWGQEERIVGEGARLRLASVGLDVPLELLYAGAL